MYKGEVKGVTLNTFSKKQNAIIKIAFMKSMHEAVERMSDLTE